MPLSKKTSRAVFAGFSSSKRAAKPATESDAGDENAVRGTVLVVGEALIDVVRRSNGHVSEHPGGSPANVALTLGRLGRPVRLLTWFGEDAYGSVLRNWLVGSRVELDPMSTGASHTSLATAILDETGAAQYDFDIEWRLPMGAEVGPDTVVVHSGSIAATLEPGSEAVLDLFSRAHMTATITYDPNMRPSLMGSPELVRERVETLVRIADVVKVSDEDLEWLYPKRSADESAAAWHERTGGIVVLTRGGSGASAWTGHGRLDVEAPKVTVVDTVGAGDSFMGALIDGLGTAGLLGARRRAELRAISPEVMSEVLAQCVRVAAITVSRAGANPPRRAELDAQA